MLTALSRILLILAALAFITACATTHDTSSLPTAQVAGDTSPAEAPATRETAVLPPTGRPAEPLTTTRPPEPADMPNIRLGTGVFVGTTPLEELLASPYVVNLASYLVPFDPVDLPADDVFTDHHAYTTTFLKNGKTWHRVRLGFFPSRARAEAVMRQARRYFPDAWIATAPRDEREEALGQHYPFGVAAQGKVTSAVGDITLNFEQADLREFIRVVFEEILNENYLVDPKVKGQVTMHTTYPVRIEAVLPIVESVLQLNGAALVKEQDIYKIVPIVSAESEFATPRVGQQSMRRATGYGVQIVPLQHVSAVEIQKVLQPFVPSGTTVRIDEARNLLILAGPQYRIDQLLDTVRIFDVDWLRGMSFGLFTLQYADAGTLVGELQNVIGPEGKTPLTGIVRLVPIERLNAVLVITHKPRYMAEVQKLIEQFDWGTEGPEGRRLYVYQLLNGKAEKIAAVLQEIYLQPGADDMLATADVQLPRAGAGASVFHAADTVARPPPPIPSGTAGEGGTYAPPVSRPVPETETGEAGGEGLAIENRGIVSIIANQDNNSILVLASPQDYRAIEAAIRKLDVPQRQVLIEATIAEVTLSETLDYGVRWFLQGNQHELAFNTPLPGGAGGDGLSLAVFNSDGDVRLFFDILETESAVKFLSTPQVMVLDNQTATIRVGDQIPVTTRRAQSIDVPNAPLITEVQFRDTGTLLTVTPRINAGGAVTLDISQEVSRPGTELAVGGGDNVSITQRTIDSSVVVQSGQTVVLGGLILESNSDTESGIPLLMDLPLIGKLFSTTSEDVFRTELIVTISPRVIENPDEMLNVTEELRVRLKEAAAVENSIRTP